jgi:osmoprotectant transport system ATP-binding protein
MIIANNISKDFNGIQAVKDVCFQVNEGHTLVLLGTSGCGKTTTLKMLNRLIQPSSGSVHINGEDIFSLKPEVLRRSIGYVSQSNGLFPHFTVAENIAIVPKLTGWNKDKILKRSDDLLTQLKLPAGEYAGKYPDQLSGGQKQRVALARALAADPPVLLMDEPFGALDPITRAGVRKEFLELPELKSKTIVLVTHDVQEAFELGDQICLMDQGKIIQAGTPKELIFRPASEFARNFLSHQRLQLELSALKFNDIWRRLPDAPSGMEADLNSFQSLWEGMELLSEKKQEKLLVGHTDSSAVKEITIQTIQSVYLEMKRNP